MGLHPGKHVIIGTAGHNYLAQCFGIQSGKSQKSPVKRVFGSEKIGGVDHRQLPFGEKANLID